MNIYYLKRLQTCSNFQLDKTGTRDYHHVIGSLARTWFDFAAI